MGSLTDRVMELYVSLPDNPTDEEIEGARRQFAELTKDYEFGPLTGTIEEVGEMLAMMGP